MKIKVNIKYTVATTYCSLNLLATIYSGYANDPNPAVAETG